jgi:predicted DsbA family dithiol-disulfide isomerase
VGYELHPETPAGGVLLADWLPSSEAMLGYVKSFASTFGIPDLLPPARLANTRRALAVAELARAQGRLEAYRRLAFDAYWRHGAGLESEEELRAIAAGAGLDPGAAMAAASDAAVLARVDAARRAAREAGVTGVPCFDFLAEADGGPARPAIRVVGCQRYEVLADAARRAGGRV